MSVEDATNPQAAPGTRGSAPEQAPSPDVYQAIVENTPDALIFADCQGAIRVWNRGAEAVFGFSAAEVLGQSLDVIIPERLRAAHWAAFDRALESGHTRLGNAVRATRALHKDGRKLYVDLSFGVVSDASGQVIGSVAMGRDCTERFLAEKARRAEGAETAGTGTGATASG